MKSNFVRIAIIGLIVLVGFGYNLFTYTVKEYQQAIVLRFGDPVAIVEEPGFKLKSPVDNIVYIDKRNLEFDLTRPMDIVTKSEKRLVVDAFIRYKITNPQTYYERMSQGSSDERIIRRNVDNRLQDILGASMRQTMGENEVEEIINSKRVVLMQQIQDKVSVEAAKFGISVIDVRIRRADYPDENADDVFERMESDYKQQAAKIRAEGQERANIVRAQTDKDVTVLLSTAEEESQKIRGRADAQRNAIFAEAYNRDLEFFKFYRSLTSYEETFDQGTVMVISPDSDYFDYFKDMNR